MTAPVGPSRLLNRLGYQGGEDGMKSEAHGVSWGLDTIKSIVDTQNKNNTHKYEWRLVLGKVHVFK